MITVHVNHKDESVFGVPSHSGHGVTAGIFLDNDFINSARRMDGIYHFPASFSERRAEYCWIRLLLHRCQRPLIYTFLQRQRFHTLKG